MNNKIDITNEMEHLASKLDLNPDAIEVLVVTPDFVTVTYQTGDSLGNLWNETKYYALRELEFPNDT